MRSRASANQRVGDAARAAVQRDGHRPALVLRVAVDERGRGRGGVGVGVALALLELND
jgi:hypothetical protein